MYAAFATFAPLLGQGKEGDITHWVGMVLLMAALGLGTVSLRFRRKTKPAKPGKSSPFQQASRMREQQAVREEMEALFVQLSDLARQLNAQMDTRFAKLEQVIHEADRKIETLEALLRKSAGVEPLDVVVEDEPAADPKPTRRKKGRGRKKADSASPSGSPSKGSSTASASSSKASSGKSASPAAGSSASSREQSEPASSPPAKDAAANGSDGKKPASGATGETQSRTAGKSSPGSDRPSPEEQRYSHIYAMADAGAGPVEIARQTGQTTGEIELILNLRKSRLG